MTMQAFSARMLASALLISLLAAPARAQRPHLGGHGGYNVDVNHGLIGAQMLFPIARNVELYPSFDYYFQDGATRFGFSGDVKLRFPMGGGSAPYLGGGLNVLHASAGGSSDTDTGWDFLFGLESRRGSTHPFVEGRVLLHDASQFQFVAGLNFTLY